MTNTFIITQIWSKTNKVVLTYVVRGNWSRFMFKSKIRNHIDLYKYIQTFSGKLRHLWNVFRTFTT